MSTYNWVRSSSDIVDEASQVWHDWMLLNSLSATITHMHDLVFGLWLLVQHSRFRNLRTLRPRVRSHAQAISRLDVLSSGRELGSTTSRLILRSFIQPRASRSFASFRYSRIFRCSCSSHISAGVMGFTATGSGQASVDLKMGVEKGVKLLQS